MTWLSKTSAMPLTAARRSSVHIVVFRAEHESLSSRCRALGGRCAGTEARQTVKHQTQVTDAPETKASTGILRSVELIHGKAPKGLGFDRPKAARSSPSSALLA
jgi:hypothetical protein